MLEVLIAMVIASFALLGLAGMQISALRYQKTASFRSGAVQHSSDLADRMRANMAGVLAGNYSTGNANYRSAAPTVPSSSTCNGTVMTACSNAELAAVDIYNFRLNLHRELAGGWGEVNGSVAAGFVVRVYYREPDKKDGVLDTKCRAAAIASTDTDIRCFEMLVQP